MSDEAISVTVLAIKAYKKFKSLRARIEPYDSLLQLDNQILDNDEILNVLCYMARPTAQHEMGKWMNQPVWDEARYDTFTKVDYIANMDYYLQAYSKDSESEGVYGIFASFCHEEGYNKRPG